MYVWSGGLHMDGKRDIIIDSSMRVFSRVGYHSATVDDILKEADIARSTFYAYFSNKREIYDENVRMIIEGVVVTLKAGVDSIVERFEMQGPPTLENNMALECAIASLMTDVYTYLSLNAGMAQVFLNELVGIDEEMTAFFNEFEGRLVDQFERLVRFGQRIDLVRELNQRRAAEFIVCGLIHLGWKVSAGQHEGEIEDICREFVAQHLRGLVRQSALAAQRVEA